MALYSLFVLAGFQPGIYSNLPTVYGILFGILVLTILPALPVILETRRGNVDIFVSKREFRTRFFGMALLSYLIGTPVALFFGSRILVLILLSYIIVTIATALITFITKLSVHMVGVTGPITYLVCILGLPFLFLHFVSMVVAWARYHLRAHSINQLIVGATVGILFTIVAYQAWTIYI